MTKNKYILPLCIIGVMFFTVGFALGINSYIVPLLQNTLALSSGESYLVIAGTFCAFLMCSYPASRVIARFGYRRTMSLAFFLFAAAFLLFIPAGKMAGSPGAAFALFLGASFLSGVANTVLQAAINPYVTILGPIDSAARRISIMGICNSLAWAVAPVFLSLVIGKEIDAAELSDITVPFYIITGIFAVLGIAVNFAPLEEVSACGEEDPADCPYAEGKTSIWQFPHLTLGALACFFYVGVETLALSSTVDYAAELGLARPETYAVWPSIGMAIGYIAGIICIPKYMSQSTALKICCWLAVVCSVLILVTPPAMSVWFVASLGLACSLMYPAIWPLALVDLGRFTKTGSSLLVASIGGGALIPLVFGFLKDCMGNQTAYWICLPCYIFILFYAYKGYKIRI